MDYILLHHIYGQLSWIQELLTYWCLFYVILNFYNSIIILYARLDIPGRVTGNTRRIDSPVWLGVCLWPD